MDAITFRREYLGEVGGGRGGFRQETSNVTNEGESSATAAKHKRIAGKKLA